MNIPSKPSPVGGMEMMLRSMGLAPVLDMAKQLASSGTLERIVKFSEDLERLQRTVDRQNVLLEAMHERLESRGQPSRLEREPNEPEPGSRPANGHALTFDRRFMRNPAT